MQESLAAFAQGAWQVLEPQTQMRWGWALDAICEHLEAVTYGHITQLLMNVPPGCMKSLLTGVLWPAWEWADPKRRALRYLGTAHKVDLATRDNLKCRRLIQSAWYQARWPLKLVSDQNAKTKFENDRTGFRESMAFNGMTGSRGDRVIIDDPLSVDSGNSEADIETTARTFTETVPTRVNDAEKSAIVMIMQRIHEKDPSGIALARALGYVHLMLPMRFEPERRCSTVIGFKDPRKTEGELLFPERFSEKAVRKLEIVLGEYATAGQLQQRPTLRGGGMFKLKFLKLWPKDKPFPGFKYVLQSYDTAFTDKTTNDPTASTTYGLFEQRSGRHAMFLLDAWDEHMRYPQLRRTVIANWKVKYGLNKGDPLYPGRKPDLALIEEKGSGISIIQDLQAAGLAVQHYNPGKADKVQRAERVTALYETEILYIPETSVEAPAELEQHLKPFVSWARPFVDQLTKFGPNVTAHDDYVDTFTQAAAYLRDAGWLELPEVEEDEPEPVVYGKKPRNPYD